MLPNPHPTNYVYQEAWYFEQRYCPYALAFNHDYSRLWITDRSARTILIVDAAHGRLLQRVQLNHVDPTGMCMVWDPQKSADNELVYICVGVYDAELHVLNSNIVIYRELDATFIDTWSHDKSVCTGWIESIAWDPMHDHLIMSERDGFNVSFWHRCTGLLIEKLRHPHIGIKPDTLLVDLVRRWLYISYNMNENGVHILNLDPPHETWCIINPLNLRCPTGIALNSSGDTLFIADCHNNRIQQFQVPGRKVTWQDMFCGPTSNHSFGLAYDHLRERLLAAENFQGCTTVFQQDRHWVTWLWMQGFVVLCEWFRTDILFDRYVVWQVLGFLFG